jgi:hypothetical protein
MGQKYPKLQKNDKWRAIYCFNTGENPKFKAALTKLIV